MSQAKRGRKRPQTATRADRNVAIGVDLGGTKIEAVAIDEAHAVLVRHRVPTERDRGYDSIVAVTAALVRDVALEVKCDVAHVPIGVGMPGSTTRSGLVRNANTVCLNGRPFPVDLERALGRPVAFDNDANCFALAEATLGAASAYRDGLVFGVIIGTGVGGGISAFGSIWRGANGIAGEWGHHAVFAGRGPLCYCGKRGCLETFASGPAVEADYLRRSGTALRASEIASRRTADAHAAEAIEQLLEAFGRGLANVIDILDPSAIVLGGGLSNLALLYDEGRARVASYVFDTRDAGGESSLPSEAVETPILKNALGDSAGVLGAALIAIAPS